MSGILFRNIREDYSIIINPNYKFLFYVGALNE